MNIVQGNHYKIKLLPPYSIAGEFDVYVSAIAKKASLNLYGDYDIREELFTKAGVGIRRYLEMVREDTDIYICHNIKEFDPPEVDTGSFIFLPASIIDYQNVDIYLTAHRIGFKLEGVRRHFDSEIEKNNFIEHIEAEIPHVLNNEYVLANDVLSVSNTQEEHLVLSGILAKEGQDRDAFVLSRKNAVDKTKKDEVDREMSYYKRIRELEKREAIYRENVKTINEDLRLAEKAKIAGANFLINVDDLMNKIKDLHKIVKENAEKNNLESVPEWEQLFRLVYKDDPKTGGTGISTSEWLQMLVAMAQNNLPKELKNIKLAKCPLCNTTLNEMGK